MRVVREYNIQTDRIPSHVPCLSNGVFGADGNGAGANLHQACEFGWRWIFRQSEFDLDGPAGVISIPKDNGPSGLPPTGR